MIQSALRDLLTTVALHTIPVLLLIGFILLFASFKLAGIFETVGWIFIGILLGLTIFIHIYDIFLRRR